MSLELRQIGEAQARAIVDCEPIPGLVCAADFPAAGDQRAAGMYLQRLEAGFDPGTFGIFFVLLVDDGPGLVVGGAGFHGAPDHAGRVEIGYGIVASHQRRGYASAAVGLLIAHARDQGAKTLIANVDADNEASRKVLTHNDFVSVGTGLESFELALD